MKLRELLSCTHMGKRGQSPSIGFKCGDRTKVFPNVSSPSRRELEAELRASVGNVRALFHVHRLLEDFRRGTATSYATFPTRYVPTEHVRVLDIY